MGSSSSTWLTVAVLAATLVSYSQSYLNSFTRLTLSDGSLLVATDSPSETVPLNEMWTYPHLSVTVMSASCVTPCLKCAWICAQKTSCESFNCDDSLVRCELFSYRPLNYTRSSGAAHFRIPSFNGICPTVEEIESIPPNPGTMKMVPAQCCNYPFTYDGDLYYSCAVNSSDPSEVGCFAGNMTWVSCFPPADYSVTYETRNLTTPASLGQVTVLTIFDWIVFQQKTSAATAFNRSWTDYRTGFGDPAGNFWLGLERLYQTTQGARHRMRIEMQMQTTQKWYSVEYESFVVDSEASGYAIHVNGCAGDACDPFESPVNASRQNGMAFVTPEQFTTVYQGNVTRIKLSCAFSPAGGFWYNDCAYFVLNADNANSFRCLSIPPLDNNRTTHLLISSRMMMKQIA